MSARIVRDDRPRDVFVHITNVERGLRMEVGVRVAFEVGEGRMQALDVRELV